MCVRVCEDKSSCVWVSTPGSCCTSPVESLTMSESVNTGVLSGMSVVSLPHCWLLLVLLVISELALEQGLALSSTTWSCSLGGKSWEQERWLSQCEAECSASCSHGNICSTPEYWGVRNRSSKFKAFSGNISPRLRDKTFPSPSSKCSCRSSVSSFLHGVTESVESRSINPRLF